MNYWPLLGIALVVIGFALQFNPLLVVVGAAVAMRDPVGCFTVPSTPYSGSIPSIMLRTDSVNATSRLRAR